MIIRPATSHDAAVLAEHRAAVWEEVGGWNAEELFAQLPIWADFFRHRLGDGTYVAFISEKDGRAIGSCGVIIQLTMPRPLLASTRAGRVQSVFVEPAQRRRGVARAMMERIIDFAREAELVSLALHPSSEGRPLYAELGFENTEEMSLRFYER